MALKSIASYKAKLAFAEGGINLLTDTLKVILMRSGFSFDPDKHGEKKNVINTFPESAASMTIQVSDNSINYTGGGFDTAGFVVGNKIKFQGSSSFTGTYTIAAITSTKITVSEDITGSDEAASMQVKTVEELTGGYGYTQDAKTLTNKAVALAAITITGVGNISFAASSKTITYTVGGIIITALKPGDSITISGTSGNNGAKTVASITDTTITVNETLTDESNTSGTITGPKIAQMTCDNADWTAVGGTIGPMPCALIYDDTSVNKTIIGEFHFGSEQSAVDGVTFTVAGIKVRIS
ncbi:hypothetical protein [Candidatus Magnetominusculus xianensis]|uniref:Uncharacterized protein n=1 Tax=Candidatus Magnetominusculus xianensis TaxID=1748249 RepID=A0ABR5SDM6_9BACT|nr:hypothetical protein [Candidatus Magnetominusculus xianensis]KWT81136.1 hypothetical protein ASN18_2642 [Candidatus Magnetominusculus xianensis]MBF0402966.1 hypothetical protein [Nitrospirota bacterium]